MRHREATKQMLTELNFFSFLKLKQEKKLHEKHVLENNIVLVLKMHGVEEFMQMVEKVN